VAEQLDRAAVLAALRDNKYNVGKAARSLGVARRTLQNRMREYGLPVGKSGKPKKTIRYGGQRGGGLLAAAGVVGALALGAVAVKKLT
jgi:hypothetical protein